MPWHRKALAQEVVNLPAQIVRQWVSLVAVLQFSKRQQLFTPFQFAAIATAHSVGAVCRSALIYDLLHDAYIRWVSELSGLVLKPAQLP